MPPRIVFDAKHRPDGLVFTSCEGCNKGARLDDLVAGFISRMYPNLPESVRDSDLKKVFSGIQHKFPGLLEKMLPSAEDYRRFGEPLPPGAHLLRLDDLRVQSAMDRFSARMGLALHFYRSGRIVPCAGGVSAKWLSNSLLFSRGLPPELLRLVGPPETLRQGESFHVTDQFEFAGVVSDNGRVSAHIATFRRSFAAIAFVTENAEDLDEALDESGDVFRPGFLATIPPVGPH